MHGSTGKRGRHHIWRAQTFRENFSVLKNKMLMSSSHSALISEAMSLWTRMVLEGKKGPPDGTHLRWGWGVYLSWLTSELEVKNWFDWFWKGPWLSLHTFQTHHRGLCVQFWEASERDDVNQGSHSHETGSHGHLWPVLGPGAAEASVQSKQAPSPLFSSNVKGIWKKKMTLFQLNQFLEFFNHV